MTFVTLTSEQWQKAVECGTARREAAARRNRSQPHGHPTDASGKEIPLLAMDIASSAAEQAVSIWTGLEWRNEIIDGALIDYPCDVGEDIEVRWTKHDHGRLLAYKGEKFRNRFVLVTGPIEGPRFRLAGWLPGDKVAQEHHWKMTPRGTMAYYIQQSRLRSALEIHRSIRREK